MIVNVNLDIMRRKEHVWISMSVLYPILAEWESASI